MLSHNYRMKLEKICNRIETHQEVSLEEMVWCEKLARSNRSAATILRKSRRKAANPEMTEDSLDGFLNALDLGHPDPSTHKSNFGGGVDDILDFFIEDKPEDWRQRD